MDHTQFRPWASAWRDRGIAPWALRIPAIQRLAEENFQKVFEEAQEVGIVDRSGLGMERVELVPGTTSQIRLD